MVEEFKELVRISGADLRGNKAIGFALRKIYGISFMFSNAICRVVGIDIQKKVGNLTSEEINKLNDAVKDSSKVPKFLLNRKKDYSSGEDKHLVDSDLKLQKEFDIKRLKKIKSYKGVRHSLGLTVRGQRTRSNFRHGKTVGVRKKGLKTATEQKK